MTIDHPAVAIGGATATAARPVVPPLSHRLLRGGLLLAGAAQLITISVLTRLEPVPATWSALLLAVAPAPLAAVAAFAPAPVNWLALAAAVAAIIVGGVGQITHTGLFFIPALVALVAGGAILWREQSSARGGGR